MFKMNVAGNATDGNPVTIYLEGEFDVYCPQFRDLIKTLIEDGARKIVVDLTKVNYVDSTALGMLITTHKHTIREPGGKLVMVCPSPRIHRVFEITGLDKIFNIVASETEALELLEEVKVATTT